jgi:protein HIRA/HIR1
VKQLTGKKETPAVQQFQVPLKVSADVPKQPLTVQIQKAPETIPEEEKKTGHQQAERVLSISDDEKLKVGRTR